MLKNSLRLASNEMLNESIYVRCDWYIKYACQRARLKRVFVIIESPVVLHETWENLEIVKESK